MAKQYAVETSDDLCEPRQAIEEWLKCRGAEAQCRTANLDNYAAGREGLSIEEVQTGAAFVADDGDVDRQALGLRAHETDG